MNVSSFSIEGEKKGKSKESHSKNLSVREIARTLKRT